MTDLADDLDSAIFLILDEYPRLQQSNPEHHLLKYIRPNDDQISFTMVHEHLGEFVHRYAPQEETPRAVMLGRYFVELRDAVAFIEGTNPAPHLPQYGPEYRPPLPPLDDIDLPF